MSCSTLCVSLCVCVLVLALCEGRPEGQISYRHVSSRLVSTRLLVVLIGGCNGGNLDDDSDAALLLLLPFWRKKTNETTRTKQGNSNNDLCRFVSCCFPGAFRPKMDSQIGMERSQIGFQPSNTNIPDSTLIPTRVCGKSIVVVVVLLLDSCPSRFAACFVLVFASCSSLSSFSPS